MKKKKKTFSEWLAERGWTPMTSTSGATSLAYEIYKGKRKK